MSEAARLRSELESLRRDKDNVCTRVDHKVIELAL